MSESTDNNIKDTNSRMSEYKEIARGGQGLVNERGVIYTKPKGFALTVGKRAYKFLSGCYCGHIHLVADGGAILEACGGDCEAHEYERALRVSEDAVRAGEETFGRPGDLSERSTIATDGAAKVHHRTVTVYRHYPDWYVGYTDQTDDGQRTAYVIVGSMREAKEQMDAWFKEVDYV